MFDKLTNLFALRFLRARKSNKLLSFLSITSVIGVMLGVAALIVVISVMDGFTDNLKAKFLGSNPHIIISHVNAYPIENWQQTADEIKKIPHVISAGPLILAPGMVSNDKNVMGVMVRGIDPDSEEKSNINDTMVVGSLEDLKNSDGKPRIIVGKEIAFSIGALVGNELTVISPRMSKSAFGMIPKMRNFVVAGYFDAGMYEHNRTLIYMDIEDAQDFFMFDNTVTALTVLVDNSDDAATIASTIQKTINSGIPEDDIGMRFWVRDWLSMNETLFASLRLEQYALFVILTLIIIVASFTIVSMITVTVKDKRKEIAILRAMGSSEKFIGNIFIKQGVTIGLLGTTLGNMLALVISFVLMNFRIVDLPKDIYFSETIPIRLSFSIFAIVTVCAIIITFIASVLPARMTAKLSPIDAIRND